LHVVLFITPATAETIIKSFMKKRPVLLLTLVTSIISFAGGIIWSGKKPAGDIGSHIYKKEEAEKSSGNWGSIYM